MTDTATTRRRRSRYLRLIALRDRVDRIATRAMKRIHADEKSEFWRGVQESSEVVATWPPWKRRAPP